MRESLIEYIMATRGVLLELEITLARHPRRSRSGDVDDDTVACARRLADAYQSTSPREDNEMRKPYLSVVILAGLVVSFGSLRAQVVTIHGRTLDEEGRAGPARYHRGRPLTPHGGRRRRFGSWSRRSGSTKRCSS